MNFKSISLVTIAMFALFILGGCGATDIASTLVKLPTGEYVSAATHRFGSWERVEIARSGERRSKNDLELARLEKEPTMPQVQITINSLEEMEIYERVKNTEAMAQANQALKEVAVAYAPNRGHDNSVVSTPFPEGAFSEAIHATGDAGKKILSTPTSIALGAGYALKGLLSEADQGAKIDSGGGDIVYKKNEIDVGDGNTGTDISGVGDQQSTETSDNSLAEQNSVDNSDSSDNSNNSNTDNSTVDNADSSDNSQIDNTDNSNNSQQPDNSDSSVTNLNGESE